MRLINWIVRLLALVAIFGLSACDLTSNVAAVSGQDIVAEGQVEEEPISSAAANNLPELPDNGVYLLKPLDQLNVMLSGPEPQQLAVEVDENGFVNMPHIHEVKAAGKTVASLSRDIQRAYIDGKIYRNITVNISTPALKYSIGGEVKQPSIYPYQSGMTLLHAIMAAGGYTEFADPKKVLIIRNNITTVVDAHKMRTSPELDVKIGVDDVIEVKRSKW